MTEKYVKNHGIYLFRLYYSKKWLPVHSLSGSILSPPGSWARAVMLVCALGNIFVFRTSENTAKRLRESNYEALRGNFGRDLCYRTAVILIFCGNRFLRLFCSKIDALGSHFLYKTAARMLFHDKSYSRGWSVEKMRRLSILTAVL